MNNHINCECGYTVICPWDRYCACCGDSLTGVNGALVKIADSVKVGTDAHASFTISNESRVTVNVHIPHIAPNSAHPPPEWLNWNRQTGNSQDFALAPGQVQTVSFGVNLTVIENMLKAPGGPGAQGNMDARFRLRLFVDADYRQQAKEVNFSLLGQADLRPAAVEFPYLWLTSKAVISLPMNIFNASGEEMVVEGLRAYTPQAEHRDIVDALFPSARFSRYVPSNVPAGKPVDIAIDSEPIEAVLEALTKRNGPRFRDDMATRRKGHWIEKWPATTRVRFVIEASLRTKDGETVPMVRSLVVLTLVRPPLLRDATPEDDLWKSTGGYVAAQATQVRSGEHNVDDGDVSELVADLINDSAMPICVDSIVSNKPWAQVVDAQIGVMIPPGAEYIVKVRIDMAKRGPEEGRERGLKAVIEVRTTPPTPLPQLDTIFVGTQSKIVLPGWLGIDFGTSNCAVCYMPAGQPPTDDPTMGRDPVVLPLETQLGEIALGGLPSLILGRLLEDEGKADRELAFGSEAVDREQEAPDNAIRGIKRMLSQEPGRKYQFRRSDPNCPSKDYSINELAGRMIHHIAQQSQLLALTAPNLTDRLLDAARRAPPDQGHPTEDDVLGATAYRFTKAVFAHPVDASESLKRTLYDGAKKAGLAQEVGAGGATITLTFEQFCATRLIDESTAAITYFVHSHGTLINKSQVRIVCVDIGGGTTDISAMTYNPRQLEMGPDGKRIMRRTLRLWHRRGINDFAGIDIDREIVSKIFAARVNEKLAANKGGEMVVDLINWTLQGFAKDKMLLLIRDKIDPSSATPAAEANVYTDVVAATTFLRDAAEKIKKAAGKDPNGKSNIQIPSYCPIRQDGEFVRINGLIIEVAHKDVNALMERMVSVRVPTLDAVVNKARWTWSDVDFLMFTGQTSRSPAIRAPIIAHIKKKRGGTLPRLVLPDLSGEADSATHIVFDPKNCVPGGAALRGIGGKVGDQIELVIPPSATYIIENDQKLRIEKGDSLPAFVPLTVSFDSGAGGSYALFYIGVEQQLPSLTVPEGTLMALVLDESEALYAVTTGAPDEPAAENVPKGLADAVKGLNPTLYEESGIAGPVVTSFMQFELPSGRVL